MLDNSDYIKQTQKWLLTVIIEHGLCPFARREYETDRISYTVIETGDLHSQLQQMILECAALDADETRETSLLIFPEGLTDFADYLDMLDVANALLVKQGYEGVYQLASFHPEYCFEGVNSDDASHYTNRSPYPMLHILRESSVETALKTYPNPEKIPERNIKLTQELGVRAMQVLLRGSYKY